MADREKLKNRVVPLDLLKLTPRTNCGKCGLASCLAFSTQVVVGKHEILTCPFLEGGQAEEMAKRIKEQLGEGIGAAREGFEKSLAFLSSEIKKVNFKAVAESLGGELTTSGGRAALRLKYFENAVVVTGAGVEELSDSVLSPYEKIFILNYVIAGGTAPSGTWVGMESLPNSISKIKSLRDHCEEPLLKKWGGRMNLLPEALKPLGAWAEIREEGADFAAEVQVLPKLKIKILFWDEDKVEGYPGWVKFLFDSRALQTLDLESLVFACEQITDRLLDIGEETSAA